MELDALHRVAPPIYRRVGARGISPPPNVAHALIDVARDYGLALNRLGAEPSPLADVVRLSTFDDLRGRAVRRARVIQGLPEEQSQAHLAEQPSKELSDEEEANVLILCRIQDTSDQLKVLFLDGDGDERKDGRSEPVSFNRASANTFTDADMPITDKQRLVLRKAWEIGTEAVVMQTVVYLDGDVITRIRPGYVKPEKRAMLDIHQKAVDTSISFWRTLVDVVRAIFGAAVGARSPAETK